MAYFANGSEGIYLENQCAKCLIPDDEPCPILLIQEFYNYEQVGNEKLTEVMNHMVDQKGNCQMKPILDRIKGGE